MRRETVKTLVIGGLVIGLALTFSELDATDKGLKALISTADSSMTDDILKPVSKLAAGGGALMGLYRTFVSSSVTPLLMWGGAGAFASQIPTILSYLF